MSWRRILHATAMGAAIALASQGALAATFHLFYDSLDDGDIIPGDIIGTGEFSYDGPIIDGSFLLSELTGVSFSAEFDGPGGSTSFVGPPFDPIDHSLIGISVTETEPGSFELVFTGGSAASGGSLDIDDPPITLSHEPATLGGDPFGPLLYFAGDPGTGLDAFGDYIGVSAVPLPPAAILLFSAFGGLLAWRRKRS